MLQDDIQTLSSPQYTKKLVIQCTKKQLTLSSFLNTHIKRNLVLGKPIWCHDILTSITSSSSQFTRIALVPTSSAT